MPTPEEVIAKAICGKENIPGDWKLYLHEEVPEVMKALDVAGYVIVPKEPTEEMIIAGVLHENMGDMAGRYKAMLAAVPNTKKPPQPEG